MLDAGLTSADAAKQPAAGPHHGIVLDAMGAFDLVAQGKSVSPSSLELLGKCPLAWFYRYGLGLRPPNDPEYDPGAWLDAAERGSVLHDVYEGIIERYRGRQREIAQDGARAEVARIADEVIARWRERVPPPGETVFEAEAAEIRRAAIAFVEMERQLAQAGDAGEWWKLELSFGDDGTPGRYDLGDGRTLGVRGRADRVDRMPGATLRVIDYKTGKSSWFQKSAKKAPFDGGRQLQPALYSAVLQALLGETVSRFEYRFPTERGENEIVAYDEGELRTAAGIVRALLEQATSGAFLPTTEARDCGFCDCQPICRAGYDEKKRATTSPRAEWAAEHAPTLEVYELIRAIRAVTGATDGDA
jgi:RecB family exonuclease